MFNLIVIIVIIVRTESCVTIKILLDCTVHISPNKHIAMYAAFQWKYALSVRQRMCEMISCYSHIKHTHTHRETHSHTHTHTHTDTHTHTHTHTLRCTYR